MFLYNKPDSHIWWILKIHNREDFNRFLVWVILNKRTQRRTEISDSFYVVDSIHVALSDVPYWWISVNEEDTTIDLEYDKEPESVKQAFIKVLEQLEIADYSFHFTPRSS